jgi:hypothetical protein
MPNRFVSSISSTVVAGFAVLLVSIVSVCATGGPTLFAVLQGGATVVFASTDKSAIVAVDTSTAGPATALYRAGVGRQIVRLSASLHAPLAAVVDQRFTQADSARATFSDRQEGTGNVVSGIEESVLHVIGADGKERVAVSDVRDLAWSPDGKRLVVVTGRYTGHDREYADLRTSVVDVQTQRVTEILSRGNFVHWSPSDGAIYIWAVPSGTLGEVLKYSPSDSNVEVTTRKCIYFSPSGKYYYRPAGIAGKPALFRAIDDSEVSGTPGTAAIEPFAPLGWSPDRDFLLVKSAPHRFGERVSVRQMLFDVDADIASTMSAHVSGWAGPGQGLIVDSERPRIASVTALGVR